MEGYFHTMPQGPENKAEMEAVLADIEAHNSARGEIYARIGAIEDPATFWACQVPTDENGFLEARLREVLILERDMSEQINMMDSTPDLTTLKSADFVGVRKTESCRNWLRGQIISVAGAEERVKAVVWLIDYGDIVKDISEHVAPRVIPDDERASNVVWPEDASVQVKALVESSPGRLVKITNWVHSMEWNKIYGDVELVDVDPPVNLRHYLLKRQLISESLGPDVFLTMKPADKPSIRPSLTGFYDDDKKMLQFSRPREFASFCPQFNLKSDTSCDTQTGKIFSDGIRENSKIIEASQKQTLSTNSYLFLPAGIDLGRDHEDRHKRAKKPKIKKIF